MIRLDLGVLLAMALSTHAAPAADEPAEKIRAAATFYGSFDEAVRGDYGGGLLVPRTRFNHETEAGKFTFEDGFDAKVFQIAAGRGVSGGGALEPVDVLPRNGRIFFPLAGNIAFDPKGWSGSASVWCDTDPNKILKTTFCDPFQITERGANNGGIWFDFNNAKPRDLRHGAFPFVPEGTKGITEDDPQAPMVRVPKIDWEQGKWHHVVITWRNFDTGRPDAASSLYIDGKLIGRIENRAIAMGWDLDKAGLYTAVNYIGLLDELALFDRELTAEEVRRMHATPDLLAPLKRRAAKKN